MSAHAFSSADVESATDSALACLAWSTAADYETGVMLDGVDADYSDEGRRKMHDMVGGFMGDETVARLFALLDVLGLPFTPGQIGHDFVLTVNRHGAGFWDGDYRPRQKAALDALSELARPYGGVHAYVSEAGSIEIDA